MQDNFFEIFLITYNRFPYLKNTFEEILAENSPLKNFPITVLDNCCTDNSSELIEEYSNKYPNVKHIRHNKNIGGNGNIARAFETAVAKYVWVICDDDTYDFSAWPEVQEAICTEKYDIILTRKEYLKGTKKLARIIRQLTFLPSGIYKTENITSGVLQNAIANIPNFFPHLAFVCEIINKKREKNIYICKKELISNKTAIDTTPVEELYIRGYDVEPHPIVKNMFVTVGLLNSILMINDKKTRTRILDNIGRFGFFGFIFANFYKNKTHYNSNELNSYYVWCAVSFRQKIEFAIALLLIDTVYYIIRLKSAITSFLKKIF